MRSTSGGAPGWSWRDVLPYFLKSENNERGASELHGAGGPLNVADLRSPHPFARFFVEAAQQAGLPRNDDFAGATQEGAGWYQVTQKNGERWSVARAYLDPARVRPNLEVVTDAFATQILFDGQRASGVRYSQGGVTIACGQPFMPHATNRIHILPRRIFHVNKNQEP